MLQDVTLIVSDNQPPINLTVQQVGAPGWAGWIPGEVPGGEVNGTTGYDGNATFTFLHNIRVNNGLPLISLYVNNGIMLYVAGQYTVSGNQVTFADGFIPLAGQLPWAQYYSG
jgi:hypothetical protein